MILILALTLHSTIAAAAEAPAQLPADRTTLGEVWEYICIEYVENGRYHNDAGRWACTNDRGA